MNGTSTARAARGGAAVCAAALLGLAACSSGSPSSSATGSPSPSPQNTAASAAAVKTVWTDFFAKTTPIAQKETLLQNGTAMAGAVQAFSTNPMVGQVTASVQKVTFPAPDKADVTYSIALNGHVVENSVSGVAVYQDGKWLVSDASLCGLLQLAETSSGSTAAIPGCSGASS